MPQITAIEPQKKRKNRFNIYLDGQFAFGIESENLAKFNLKIGSNLATYEVSSIIAKEETSKLTDYALRFLSLRPRSEEETRDYLVKKIIKLDNVGYQQAIVSPLIDKVITKLKRYQYLNDNQFAQWLTASRTGSNPRGVTLIKLELVKRGVNRQIIESVLSQVPNQTKLAQKALEKKLRHWQGLSPQNLKKKVYSYLASRGFDWSTIGEVFAFLSKKR